MLMRKSVTELQKNDPLRMAGATAFFATFALPPMLIILIRLFGLFINRRVFVSGLFARLPSLLDNSSVLQVRETLRNIRSINQQWYLALIGFIFFLFVASTLFNIIKNSLEQIWKIALRGKKSFAYTLKSRATSIVILILAGFLFVITLLTESIRTLFGNYVEQLWPVAGKLLNGIANEILFLATVLIWFTVLFRMLTNGRPQWKICFAGGALTAFLFTIGKYIVRYLLALSNIGTIYGTSGSVVLIMLFVFYSSIIFYYGACFVKVLSDHKASPIVPVEGAFNYEIQEVNAD
ncbi:YihY/virulence factor BrkB family protein [Pedobacter sp. BS3]|nr:YihY/virulence factor BrkB family protein [Pedobacter sp. BS3]